MSDYLGTPRMIIERTGSLAGIKRHDSLPFGEELTLNRTVPQGYVTDSVRQGFGGYEEDSETGLDFAQARYYASGQGRFTSVDPLLASMMVDNPQTLNRYSYVLNRPLTHADPSGLFSYEMSAGIFYHFDRVEPDDILKNISGIKVSNFDQLTERQRELFTNYYQGITARPIETQQFSMKTEVQ